MRENNDRSTTSISNAHTLGEIGDFWDTHSLENYWDRVQEVDFEVRARKRHRVIIEPDIYAQLEAQAHVRGVLPETLVNLWLIERLQHGDTVGS